MGTLGRWCFRRRWVVLGLWIVAFAGMILAGGPVGGAKYSNSFTLPGNESTQALEMFGHGMVGAVALDAFFLRTMLVPALMHLFGKSNWWLPRWLDRSMPHLSVEPADEHVVPPKRPADDSDRSEDRLVKSES